MIKLKFVDGFAVQDFSGKNVQYTISAFVGALKSANKVFDKNVQGNDINKDAFQYSMNEPKTISEVSSQYNLNFLEAPHIKSVTHLNYDGMSSNLPFIQKSFEGMYSVLSDIIDEDKVKEVNIDMHQKLVNRRNDMEKTGIIIGFIFGSVSLLPSLLSFVDWAATVPASILFFSLPAFVLIRQRLRGENS